MKLISPEMLTGMFIFFGIGLIISVLFLLTQQNLLKAIRVENRTISPGKVWLQLIPFFGAVWQFFVVSRIAESLRREITSDHSFSFEEHQENMGYEQGTKPTYAIGLAYCILMLCGIIPIVGVLASVAGLVCWIIYWVRISSYKNKLQQITYGTDTSVTAL